MRLDKEGNLIGGIYHGNRRNIAYEVGKTTVQESYPGIYAYLEEPLLYKVEIPVVPQFEIGWRSDPKK